MIFSRRSRAGRHLKAESLEEVDLAQPAEASVAPAEGTGPFDLSEAPAGLRIDLGSLQIPALDGVEIRAQAGEDGVIQQLELSHGDNALQLGVFAAPRTDSLWEEVRPEIRKALSADGAGAEEVAGRWGTELRARLRTPQGPDDLRFVGIDGPRWMVRAVFRGPAAIDPDKGGPLNDCLTGLVVNRDDEARPTGEPLPLRLPQEAPSALEQQAAEAPGEVSGAPRREPSPRPRKN